ncbi:hypothetical protein [Streptomyces sp. NPDC001661]
MSRRDTDRSQDVVDTRGIEFPREPAPATEADRAHDRAAKAVKERVQERLDRKWGW